MVNYVGAYAAPRADLGVPLYEFFSDGSEFAGPRILPIFRTAVKASTYSAITRDSMLQDSQANRAVRSAYNRISQGAKDKTYSCKEYGLEIVVDDAERRFYLNDFDAEASASRVLARALMLQYEKRVAAAVFNATTWTGASLFTDNSANPWSTVTTDIIGQVLAAKEKVRTNSGMMPNALIISATQLANVLKNTGIKAQFVGVPVITLELIQSALSSIFGLTKLIVVGAMRNSAIEGQTAVLADVWSDVYAMVAIVGEEGESLAEPQLGRTFLWAPDSPDLVTAEMYREEQSRGEVLRVRHATDEVIIDPLFAHLMDVKA